MVKQSHNGCLTEERWGIWYEGVVSTIPAPGVLKASRIPGELWIFILLWNSEQVTSVISAGML